MAPGAPSELGGFYAAIRLVGRLGIWFHFRSVDARNAERVPRRGPVLLCINHPNNLIDSLLVGAVLPRKVHYLATAALFRNPVVARFLRACGAIPIYRRQDDPDKMERNVQAFAACILALRQGRLIGIYPEGTTHAEARVQRIKTGAARIALDYEIQRPAAGGEPLALVPVGLTFEARKAFRGRVHILFGEPIPVAPYLPAYREDPAKAVDALTTAIQWGMEEQVLDLGRLSAADLARQVDELYRDALVRELQAERGLSAKQIDTLRLSRAIADAVAHFEAHDPARVRRLSEKVLHYRAMLAAYEVRDGAVRARLERPAVRRRLLRPWEAALGLPLFGYGALVNALPYLVPRWLARRTARKETDYATTRFLASIVAFPLFWGLEVWLVWRWAGAGWALAFALSLPLSGLAAYRYLGGIGRLRSQVRLGLLSLARREAASRLLAARQEIVADLDQAKTDYLAATRGSSF